MSSRLTSIGIPRDVVLPREVRLPTEVDNVTEATVADGPPLVAASVETKLTTDHDVERRW